MKTFTFSWQDDDAFDPSWEFDPNLHYRLKVYKGDFRPLLVLRRGFRA